MRIIDYQNITSLAPDDIFIVNTEIGTKTIQVKDVMSALFEAIDPQQMVDSIKLSDIDQVPFGSLSENDRLLIGTAEGNKGMGITDAFWSIVDECANGNISLKRGLYRGKDLGSKVTDEQWEAIRNGTFKGLFLGDYWVINNVYWRIMDFNYWFGTGDQECKTNHIVMMPQTSLYTAQMNTTASTAGGYFNTRKTVIVNALSIVNNVFGTEHALNHRDFFTNAVTSGGVPSAAAWYDSITDLPNEPMIYGSYALTPGSTGANNVLRQTIDKTQLAVMRMNQWLIQTERQRYWLRDVASVSQFTVVDGYAMASRTDATENVGIRPVFGLIG